MKSKLIAAFEATRDGFSADRVVADPALNATFVAKCRELELVAEPATLNRALINLRKTGHLRHLKSRRTSFKQEDSYCFNVIGGSGRYAIFHLLGEWQYDDPNGSDTEVRLWDSDQGYFCRERNVLTDIQKVLRIAKAFYDTGSYRGLDDVE